MKIQLQLTIHKAYFLPKREIEYYFITTTNISKRDIEVTHIWFDCEPRVHVLTRKLPKRLRPNETWETWIPINAVPLSDQENPYMLARARLSTGTIIHSCESTTIPEQGYVPGEECTDEEFTEGCLWEGYPWKIRYNYEFCDSAESETPPCRHCHSHRVESETRHDDDTGEEWEIQDVYWTCPAVVVAYNEGGYNSTGVCLQCILEAAQTIIIVPDVPE